MQDHARTCPFCRQVIGGPFDGDFLNCGSWVGLSVDIKESICPLRHVWPWTCSQSLSSRSNRSRQRLSLVRPLRGTAKVAADLPGLALAIFSSAWSEFVHCKKQEDFSKQVPFGGGGDGRQTLGVGAFAGEYLSWPLFHHLSPTYPSV